MEDDVEMLGSIESFVAAKIDSVQSLDRDLGFCCIALQQPLMSGARHRELIDRLIRLDPVRELDTVPHVLCDELHKKNVCYVPPPPLAIPHHDFSQPKASQ